MTQRIDSENELITCDVNGRLLMWDCDYREPVQVGRVRALKCATNQFTGIGRTGLYRRAASEEACGAFHFRAAPCL